MKKSLGKRDIEKLIDISSRLKELSSLKRANFSFDENYDKRIKTDIAPFMTWFESCAYMIDNIIEGEK